MPVWAKEIFTFYGPLALFAFWVFYVAVPRVYRDCFSRDLKNPGLVTQKIRASAAKDERLAAFVDALEQHDGRQEQLCQLHATMAEGTNRRMGNLGHAGIVACRMFRDFVAAEYPNSAERISQHCDEIERIISGEA